MNRLSVKIATSILGLAMVFSFTPLSANAQTVAELTAQINSLLATISALQAQLSNISGGGSSASVCPFTWTRSLTTGSTGDDVKALQQFLNSDAATQVASSGAGSPGNESSYFGPATRGAVVKFQDKYASEVLAPVGLSAGTGYFGSSSRAKANALCATAPTTPPPTTTPGPSTGPAGTTLTVAAASQPANSLAPASAARVPFTRFTVTASNDGDIVLNGVTVERTGLANDSNFAGIVLLDDTGTQIGLSKTLNSNHQATIGEDVTIPRGTTKTFTVAGNMKVAASLNAGEVATFAVVSLNTSASVVGSLPITGAAHTINATLTIGSVTVTAGSETSATKNIDTLGYRLTSFRLTAGSAEKVYLNSVRWNQVGSAGKDDLANVKTVVDGVEYPAVVSSDGKYYTTVFPGGVLFDKGFTKEIWIKADIVGGSGRTVIFDIYKTTDLNLSGETYSYGITPPAGAGTASDSTTAFTAGTPWLDGAAATIAGGSLTVSKAATVTSQNIAENAPNQVLGGFEVEAKGESVTVGSLVFGFRTTGTMNWGDLTNITLVDPNGSVVAGPVDAASGVATFSSSITFPVGKGIYTLKGKVGTDADNNDTVYATTTPSSDWTSITGQSTGNSITASPTTELSGNTMTVKTANVAITVAPTPVIQTIVAGSDFTFANYTFDASQSGDDVKFSSIPLDFAAASGTPTNLSGCTLWDGSTALTTGSNKVDPTAANDYTNFTLDNALVIPRQTSKSIALSCHVQATSTGQIFQWGINNGTPANFTASGVDSGVALTGSSGITVTTNAGQQITVNAGGSYTVVDDTTPGYRIVSPGQEVELLRLKFSATDEDVDLRQLALQLSSVASNTPLDLVGQQLTLWDGGTQVGTATFNNGGDYATSTIFNGSTFRIPKGSAKTLVVKGTISNIAVASSLEASGDLLIVSYDGNASGLNGGNYGSGVSSGTTVSPSTASDVTPSGVRIMKGYPTFAKLSLPSNVLITGSQKALYRFSVTANNGDVNLYKFTFTIGSSTVSATTSAYGLYSFTDSSFSSADTQINTDGIFNYGNAINSSTTDNTSYVGVSPLNVEVYPKNSSTATTTYKVPSGGTRYFELRATVASVETGSGSEFLTVVLEGDSAFPTNQATLMLNAVGADADTNDDFIWSPNSTATSNSVNNLDWTNGYQVSGLPANGMPSETLTSSN